MVGDFAWYALGRIRGPRFRVGRFYRRVGPVSRPWPGDSGRRSCSRPASSMGPRRPACSSGGCTDLPLVTFLMVDTIGVLIGSLVFTGLGYLVSGSATLLLGKVRRVELWLLGALIVGVVLVFVINWTAKKELHIGNGEGERRHRLGPRPAGTCALASIPRPGHLSPMDPDLLLAEPAGRQDRRAGPRDLGGRERPARIRAAAGAGPPHPSAAPAGSASPARRAPASPPWSSAWSPRTAQPASASAVVAVDPTSPFTGGALLGDRIRMESVALDQGVYIRSMATRGSLGGLATTTREVCDVLDAAGFDRILIETVGVGQIGARRRPDGGHHGAGARARVGRRHPDAQVRRHGDRRRVRGQQGRPAGRGQAAPGDRGDARHPAGQRLPERPGASRRRADRARPTARPIRPSPMPGTSRSSSPSPPRARA